MLVCELAPHAASHSIHQSAEGSAGDQRDNAQSGQRQIV